MNIFGWLLLRSCLLSRYTRNRLSPGEFSTCTLCSRENKYYSHLFFQCPFVRLAWGSEGSSSMDSWTAGQRSPFATPSGAAHTAVKLNGKNSLRFSGLSGYTTTTRSPSGAAHSRPWLSYMMPKRLPAFAIAPQYFIILCSSNDMRALFLGDPLFLFKKIKIVLILCAHNAHNQGLWVPPLVGNSCHESFLGAANKKFSPSKDLLFPYSPTCLDSVRWVNSPSLRELIICPSNSEWRAVPFTTILYHFHWVPRK